MTLLNAKSDEIADLSHQLEAEHAKNAELVRRVEMLEQQLRSAQLSADGERNRAEMYVEKAQVVSEALAAALEKSKTTERALAAANADAADAKRSLAEANAKLDAAAANEGAMAKAEELSVALNRAESNLKVTTGQFEDLKTQFMMETGKVSVLRKEKKKLEQELEIAQAQSVDGVKAVKAMLEKKIEETTLDRNRWRDMANFLKTIYSRTDDDVRRRAAEEPELRRRCHHYHASNRQLRDDNDVLSRKVERLKDRLRAEREVVAQLQQAIQGDVVGSSTLSLPGQPQDARPGEDGSDSDESYQDDGDGESGSGSGFETGSDSGDEDDVAMELQTNTSLPHAAESADDMVYRCEWRLGNDKLCNGLYSSHAVSGLTFCEAAF